jgi:MFS transporter, DHA3 family, macrolide efflux protein
VIVGGLLLGVWGGFQRKVYTSMLGLLGMGAGTLLIAFAQERMFWLALAGMGLMGVMNPITNGPLFALLQGNIRADMQGRIFTLMGSFSAAMSPLGMIAAAPVADAVGIQFWYTVAGVMAIVMAVTMVMIPSVVRLEADLKADALRGQAGETAVSLVAASD